MGFDEEKDWKDILQEWCNSNGKYELAQRIAFVPEDVLKKLLFESPENAVKILESEGY